MTIGPADRQSKERFQNGLLTWLRAAAPQEHANGLREMIAVTRALAATESSAGDGLLWRSAASFLQALLDGTLATDDEARALCRRLERHLARRCNAAPAHPEALADAIFAFVSKRQAAGPGDFFDPEATTGLNALPAAFSSTFTATADVLPLLGQSKPRRFSDAQLTRWTGAAHQLRRDWNSVQAGKKPECRASAIALLQVALELADAPSLRLAEGLAEAAGISEDRAILGLPSFRAAFAAALECAEHAEGPDRAGFDELSAQLAERLARAALPPRGSDRLVCVSAPWFAEDAQETLTELAAALDAVPPQRPALLAGFDWFVQHESTKTMAIRGLATTAHRIVSRIRADDLDQADTHAIIGRTIAALTTAVNDLAAGSPPEADAAAFAELRALDAQIAEHRRLAIAARSADIDSPAVPAEHGQSLQ